MPAVAVIASLSVPLLSDTNGVRATLAVPLVLFLPGYALSAALFPARWGPGIADRLVLGLGLSVAVVVLGGLALNTTPWGLQARSCTVLLCGATIAASLVALRRRSRLPLIPMRRRSPFVHPWQAILVCLAVIMAGAAVHISAYGAVTHKGPGFTQLSIQPTAQNSAVNMRVACMESQSTTYRLVLELGGHTVRSWPSIRLSPGTAWDTTVAPPRLRTAQGPVTALLYRTSAPHTVYRRVQLWMDG